jgi:aminoglycoside/choline kinase family phosphotransferase
MKDHITWAIETLKKQGYSLSASFTPELIKNEPYSEVSRFSTQQGNVYLKKTPPALAIEMSVIQLLKEKFHIAVPTITAENHEESCFLMEDAGVSLRAFFKQGFNADILVSVLNEYAHFQIETANQLSCFINLGVPDWGLTKLPSLYQDLVQQENLLQKFQLTPEEISQCQNLIPTFQNICERLAQYNLPDTFGHCDFHDNNMLIDPKTHQTTMIDLGEVVITHPFFSVLNMLVHVKENSHLSPQQFEALQQHAFKPWLKHESLPNLQAAMALIQRCWLIHAILGIYRLMLCVDPIEFENIAHQNRFANKLRLWISQAHIIA